METNVFGLYITFFLLFAEQKDEGKVREMDAADLAITTKKKGKTRIVRTPKDQFEDIQLFLQQPQTFFNPASPVAGAYVHLPSLDIYLFDSPTPQLYKLTASSRTPVPREQITPEIAAQMHFVPKAYYPIFMRLSEVKPAPLLEAKSRPTLPETPWTIKYEDGVKAWNNRLATPEYAISSADDYLTYMKHLRDTTEFSNADIDAVPLGNLPPLGGSPIRKVEGKETLRKILLSAKNDANPVIKAIWYKYITISFIRNVIDFLHDYVHVGVTVLPALIGLGRTLEGKDEQVFSEWFNKGTGKIYSAITAGGKVSQNQCKELSDNLVLEFKTTLKAHPAIKQLKFLDWLIDTREEAFVMSANKDNPAEIAALLQTAYNNGCRGIYIESLQTSATRLFSQAPAVDMAYYDVASGYWDAGPGISYAEAARVKPGLQRVILSRRPTNIADSVQLLRTINAGGADTIPPTIGNTSVGGFGLFPIKLYEDIGRLETLSPFGSLNIAGRQRLSVNGLLTSVGLPGVRGSGEAGATIQFSDDKGKQINFRGAPVEAKLVALCLKQWTDTIQTDDIVNSERNILAVYSDFNAETYCAMIGGTSILQRGNELVYYCYDLTKKQISPAELDRKRKNLRWAQRYIVDIKKYLEQWSGSVKSALAFMMNDTEDPAIFFAALTTYEHVDALLYNNIADTIITHPDINNLNDVASFPSTGSQLYTALTDVIQISGMFEETYRNLQRVIDKLTEIRAARLDPNDFIQAYGAIEQEIINALPTTIDDGIVQGIVQLFFAYGFLLPFDELEDTTAVQEGKVRSIDNIILSLKSTIEELNKSQDQATAAKLENVGKTIESIRGIPLFGTPFINILESGIKPARAVLGVPPSPVQGGGRRRWIRSTHRGRRHRRTRKH